QASDDPRTLNQQLLAAYKRKCPAGWTSVPDDGYICGHLTWHLVRANQQDAIHALLCEETSNGQLAWYQARERLGQTSGFISDVALGLELATNDLAVRPAALG